MIVILQMLSSKALSYWFNRGLTVSNCGYVSEYKKPFYLYLERAILSASAQQVQSLRPVVLMCDSCSSPPSRFLFQ